MSEKIRTPDTLVRSQVLYPAELHSHFRLSFRSMPATGIEPVPYCYDRILSPARLPVPPRRQVVFRASSKSSVHPSDEVAVTFRIHNIANLKQLKLRNGTNRARTCDPLLVRQVLSQLSYDPISVLPSDPSGTRTRDLRRDRAAL